jgi:hypothetical protein
MGGVSEKEWKRLLESLPMSPGAIPKGSIDLFVMKAFLNAAGYKAILGALRELGLSIREVVYDPSERNSAALKRMRSGDMDLWFVYEGVNDPDPDSAWRYMMEYYPGKKKPVTAKDLDTALLTPSRNRREAMYREFESRNLRSPFIIPIRMVGSKIYVRSPLKAPEGDQFEWGVQFWNFRVD